MPERFVSAVNENQGEFALPLPDETVDRLAAYYNLVIRHNDLLHLVAPCSPEEFAVRHVLESLTLLEHLPRNAAFADIGTGAGLPSIPCLLVREDLRVLLIESKEKKARFLQHAVNELGLASRAQIINKQFEETEPGDAQLITCRALDRFTQKLPKLLKWSKGKKLLLFGGPALDDALTNRKVIFKRNLLPLSKQRFLFQIEK